MAKSKAKKKTTGKKKKKGAKNRGALVTVGSRSGVSTMRRSGASPIDSWKSAILSSALMRAGSGLFYYFTRTQKIDIPHVQTIIPATVAVLANNGIIPIPGLFPVAVDQAVNTMINTSKTLRDIFEFKFMDKQSGPKPVAGPTPQNMTVRQLARTRAILPETSSYRSGRVSINAMNRTGMPSSDYQR